MPKSTYGGVQRERLAACLQEKEFTDEQRVLYF